MTWLTWFYCAPPALGLICDRFSYKHSAPPELNARWVAAQAALCNLWISLSSPRQLSILDPMRHFSIRAQPRFPIFFIV